MHILVTGGAGFIGSAVVDQLLALGHDVRVVDLLHPGAHRQKPTYLDDRAAYTFADLRDPDVAAAAVAGIDAVCHQAAMVGLGVDFADVTDYVSHNDLGTAALLRALHDRAWAGRFVLASSMVVYGEGRYRCAIHGLVRPAPRPIDRLDTGRYEPLCPNCDAELTAEAVPETTPPDPRNVYAATKLQQEFLVNSYAREHDGTEPVSLRYHNVYGPRMPRNTPYAGVASIFRSAAERGEGPMVFEDGGQRRDFVHVDDIARANVASLTVPASLADGGPVGGPYNVATGDPHTVLDMATALVAAVGANSPRPEVVGGYRLGDVRHVFASPERAAEVFGFRASVTFDDGMVAFASAELRD